MVYNRIWYCDICTNMLTDSDISNCNAFDYYHTCSYCQIKITKQFIGRIKKLSLISRIVFVYKNII